jgi:hypothetical protein
MKNQTVEAVLDAMEQIIHAYEATVPSIEFKHHFIFDNLWNKKLEPALKNAGLDLNWYYDDVGYEDELTAFVTEVRKMKEMLERMAL